MKKRVISGLLTLCMILSLLPVTVLAADGDVLDIAGGDIIIDAEGPYTVSGTTTNKIIVKSSVTCDLTINGLNIAATDGPAIRVEEGATLNLHLVGENTLKGAPGYAGISVAAAWDTVTQDYACLLDTSRCV